MVELSITIKSTEKKLSKKYLVYEPFVAVEHDPTIKNCIDELLKEFAEEPDSINVRINISVK
jgi:hypothetical protein